jgi:hypothetical protein
MTINSGIYASTRLHTVSAMTSKRVLWNRHGRIRHICKSLVVKISYRNPVTRSRKRWKNIFKVDFKEIRCENGRWTKLRQNCNEKRVLVY